MLAVLLAASGGHWMVLQSLAWTRMLVSYSQSGDFAGAVSKTFSGQYPCSLCKKIERAKSNEPPQRVMQLESKASFLVPSRVVVLKDKGISWEVEVPQKRLEQRFERPGAPPPRSALA
jgi:hypothetical protein